MASNFNGYLNRNFFDRDWQNSSQNGIFRKIEIQKIGNILTNNSRNFRDHQMSSKNLVVLKIRGSNYPNWAVYLALISKNLKHNSYLVSNTYKKPCGTLQKVSKSKLLLGTILKKVSILEIKLGNTMTKKQIVYVLQTENGQ